MNYRSDVKVDWGKTLSFVGIVLVLQFIGSLALTVGKGFEDPAFTTRFIVYVLFAVIGLGFIVFTAFKNSASRKRVFLVPLHEPEEMLVVGRLKVFRNPVLFFLLSLLIFIPVFFVSAKFANTFFSGIPFASQQVSVFSSLWGSAGFPAIAENLLMYIPIILLLSLNFRLFYKAKFFYWFNNLLSIPLIMAFVWRAFHNLVYGADEFAGIFTFVFSYVGVLLTLLTMSFIVWFVIHFLSNFMLSARNIGLLANDYFIILLVVVWFVLLFSFVLFNYYGVKRKRGVYG